MTSRDQLEAWIAAALPTRTGWTITDRQPAGSFQQSMERVTLHWDAPVSTEVVYVRVYQGYLSWWTLTAPDLPRREQAAQRAAARAGVPTAEVLYMTEAPDVAIHRCVAGEARQVPMTPEAAEDLAATLARLHAAAVPREDRMYLPDVSLRTLLPRLATWAEEAESVPLRREVDAMSQRLAPLSERPPVLIHGDLHPGNFLSDGQHITAILDWEEAAFGDPRLDVANIFPALMKRAPAGIADHFLRCYAERTGVLLDTPQPWLELTDLRNRMMSAWVKHALAQGQRLPSDRPERWIED